ncbi:MAG: hypothetical protein DRJ49_02160 [Thermoprotei archaeon]|nr:MAG: hypothetical protein DRJ49_02160 [Thermoprotei archaeon]
MLDSTNRAFGISNELSYEMIPSISTSVFPELELEEEIKRLAKIGWRCVEINLGSSRVDKGRVSKIAKLCEELDISIIQVHGRNPGMARRSEEERRKFMRQAKESIIWAGELGAKWVVLHPSNRKAGYRTLEALNDVKRSNLEGFLELLEVAEATGVGIAIENLPPVLHDSLPGESIFGADPYELLWLVKSINSKRIGICLDTNHIIPSIQGFDQYQVIKIIGQHLVATHISDNDGFREQHLLPFMGKIDWNAVVRGLKEVGYRGAFNLEVGFTRVPLKLRDSLVSYALRLLEELVKGQV